MDRRNDLSIVKKWIRFQFPINDQIAPVFYCIILDIYIKNIICNNSRTNQANK